MIIIEKIHSFIRLFIHSFIHLFIHSFKSKYVSNYEHGVTGSNEVAFLPKNECDCGGGRLDPNSLRPI